MEKSFGAAQLTIATDDNIFEMDILDLIFSTRKTKSMEFEHERT